MRKKRVAELTIIAMKCEICNKLLDDQSGYTEECDQCLERKHSPSASL